MNCPKCNKFMENHIKEHRTVHKDGTYTGYWCDNCITRVDVWSYDEF